MRRLSAALAMVFLLVLAAPASAQNPNGDPPATGGQSGAGGNVPGAGNTGGGSESPTAGDARANDGDSTSMKTIFILTAVGAAVIIVGIRINERRRDAEARMDRGTPVSTA